MQNSKVNSLEKYSQSANYWAPLIGYDDDFDAGDESEVDADRTTPVHQHTITAEPNFRNAF